MLDLYINPGQDYISEWKTLDNGVLIHKYAILTTPIITFDVWEPSAITGKHSTITTINGRWYGCYTTRCLPPEIEALPAGSDERVAAVRAYHQELKRQAEAMIRRAFPADFVE